jgi:hypothetical protein
MKKSEMGRACSTYWERRGAYRDLVGKPEGRRPLVRPRSRWEDNIKMYLREVEWEAWTGSIWLKIGQLAGCCECGNEPSGSIKCLELSDWLRTC